MAALDRRGAAIMPRAVTVLGELGSWVFEFHADRNLYGMKYRASTIVCSSSDGRSGMWFLRPIADAGPVRRDALAVHAANLELYERFMHRRAEKYFNVFLPPFKQPRLLGGLAVIRYLADKGVDGGGEVEWEHYFEGPDAPAYPRIYTLGCGQYFIAPGPWRVGSEGIDFAR